MPADILFLRLLLAFGSGWLVVAAVTTVADAFGAGRAGFAGGLPSTGPVSLLFIGWTQTQAAAVQAAVGFPLSFSVTFAFLLFYALPARLRFGPRMTLALSLWLLLTVLVVLSGLNDFILSVAMSVVSASAVYTALRLAGIKSVPPVPTPFDVRRVVLRGTLGGCVVAGVVLLSITAGPLVGGLFIATPAIWTSSLYVTSRAQGLEFSRSLAKSFITVGMLTIVPFGFAVRYLFIDVGVWWGTLLAYVAITPMAWLAWRLTASQPPAAGPEGS
ncbi:MAG TPA: hypothetical protein VEC02_07265 [Nitrososphaerales archaeon]|nr:hypothetical protein [Nitrososphaerales archaeon]